MDEAQTKEELRPVKKQLVSTETGYLLDAGIPAEHRVRKILRRPRSLSRARRRLRFLRRRSQLLAIESTRWWRRSASLARMGRNGESTCGCTPLRAIASSSYRFLTFSSLAALSHSSGHARFGIQSCKPFMRRLLRRASERRGRAVRSRAINVTIPLQ